MSKSTKKVSSQVKGLTNAEYAKLLTAVAEYRSKIKSSQKKVYNSKYGRIFTEPRMNGLRSKYWLADASFSRAVAKYVKLNPTITVGKKVYKVTVKQIMPNYIIYQVPAVSLHVAKA
jgi:hypothetical protein